MEHLAAFESQPLLAPTTSLLHLSRSYLQSTRHLCLVVDTAHRRSPVLYRFHFQTILLVAKSNRFHCSRDRAHKNHFAGCSACVARRSLQDILIRATFVLRPKLPLSTLSLQLLAQTARRLCVDKTPTNQLNVCRKKEGGGAERQTWGNLGIRRLQDT